ncbi:GNAT family N-acetyltransferase [Lysinibacillus capsici]|uniref:GNAT family N-acetyltransferase n=1 Tax=Lysinibacillus capsici TaxID=2115968 RepID=A0ABY8KJ04_9BACI|nr:MULTISPECIES: GNAT family N-acetyltransferase [Lysinibacillus]AUS87098.1 GNAT family N-acetyltransferase [Lysinibacillus sp. YS11]MCT1538295.1 GNAT family N-acetyltransferase [Lysinibacillus capsici]MCT1569003.1 GNAT family N-acetyltransferase [Lysinibacillus capsici]MCT1646019.1 GNAT family N-acetyltransferase [Lysinibacillus capsici]MCT1725476.1 GNAT family N-acetyltransferase [Lysinibacillus capsici]
MNIRSVQSSDYYTLSPLINEWWGGRNMSDKLPKLFFDHFTNTSLIMEKDGEIIGFLIGFLSQSKTNEAFIHFVGVHPDYRKQNIAKRLYDVFFHVVKQYHRNIVKCVTSPINEVSIAFHTNLGFRMEKGDKVLDNMSIHSNYGGENQDRVLFYKILP